MSDIIKLVQGDTLPTITVTLTDEFTGTAVNLTGATVIVKFRAANTATVLASLACTLVGAAAGIFSFAFPAPTLDVEPGLYEGEIQVTFAGGEIQSVYDVLKFRVRADF
jgi:hypothetical protein